MRSGTHEEIAADEGSLARQQEMLPGDLYELLQVSPRASLAVIQAAYRVLARTYHPDVSASPETARMMRCLNAAYDVLSDPKRRARYDAKISPPPPRQARRPRAHVTQTHRVRSQLALSPERATGAQLLARVLVITLLISMTVGAMVFAWVLLVEPDDRPSPGYRPRTTGPEISVPAASGVRSSRWCAILGLDSVSC